MSKISRRSFIGAAAAIPFTVWFEKYGAAQTVKIRYSAYSTQGIAMLNIYRSAVAKMMDHAQIPEGDPASWVFQWYTHAVPPPGKASEIARIYPTANPNKAKAQAVWNTCQAHFSSANQPWFLPWHRMFVYYFERTIRKVSGNANFTLPYWNYSATGVNHGRIPPQFRVTSSSLFVQKRNVHTTTNDFANVNAGAAIDQFAPGILSISSLAQCRYLPTSIAVRGFNETLDNGLHGNVHVYTGNQQNMGAIPWAAGDPVFWMHHCNIDRLWASWNKAGRLNPTTDTNWMNKSFQFVDENGNLVSATVKDFVNLTKLGYQYDAYETPPTCPPTILSAAAEKVHASSGSLTLSASPARATLTPQGAAAASLSTQVKKIKPGHYLYLVLENAKAEAAPGVAYHVYLGMPQDTTGAATRRYYAGTINFFDASPHADHEGGDVARIFSLDVTALAKRLALQNKLGAAPSVTIVPSGEPAAEARPTIGSFKLIEN